MIEISLSNASAEESSSNFLRFTVSLSEASIDTVSVVYRTLLNGTATDDDLWNHSADGNNNGVLTFAPGELTKDIFIRAGSDSTDEVDEAVILELSSPSANAVFPGGQHVLRNFGVILDNDGATSNLAVFVSDPIISEAADEVAFDIRLSRPAESAFNLTYKTADITATAGEDYTAMSGTINVLAGQSSARVVVPLTDDMTREIAEQFALIVEPPSSPEIDTTGAVGVATLLDSDSPTGPSVSIEGGSVLESSSYFARFTVTLSEPAIDAVQVSYRTLRDQTATDPDLWNDFADSNNNGVLTFAPGETTRSIFIRSGSDSFEERDEAFTLELYNLSDNASFANGENSISTKYVILDNDGVGPDLALFVGDPKLTEGDSGEKEAVFEIKLSRPAAESFTVTYETADITASAGTDYAATSGSITFEAGQDRAAVVVPVFGDDVVENTESFALNVTTPSTVSIGQKGLSGEAYILDDDAGAGPEISIEQSHTVTESSSYFIRYVVSLSEASDEPVTVDYQTTLGTAADNDLWNTSTSSSNNGTLTIPAGATSANIFIRAGSDTTDERDESVFVTLSNPTGALLAGGAQTLRSTAFIQDNDGVGLNIALAGTDTSISEPEEGSKLVRVPVSLSQASDTELTFNVVVNGGTATVGTDFDLLQDTVTFAPGQVNAGVLVRINGDENDEGLETFLLNYAPQPGAIFAGVPSEQTITIRNTEPPFVNTPPTGAVTVSGTTEEGETLAAETSTIDDADGLGALAFQWLRNGAEISGATASVYTLTADDIGARIAVSVSYTDGAGTDETLESATTDVIEERTFVNTPPTGDLGFAGDLLVGETLAADTSDIVDPDGLGPFSYQWLRDGEIISGATSSLYTLTDTDVGARISLRVSYTDGEGTDELVQSSASETVEEASLDLTGTPGPDVLQGGANDDVIRGLAGDDRLLGNEGNDRIEAGDGTDTVNGGPGDDTIIGGDSTSDRRDVIFGGDGNDTIDAGYGNDLIYGQAGNDTIAGGFGADELYGQDDDDVITGSAFSDLIFGGAGDDFVNGGFGFDRINGGEGADKFFHAAAEGHGSDWLQDYSAAEGDVLIFGGSGATADDFVVRFAHTATPEGERSGDDSTLEAFVNFRGQTLWALVDGGGEASINLQIGSDVFDLLV